MNRFNTLRFRFALWVAGLMLLVFAAFGTFVYFSVARGVATAVDDSLRLSATQAIATVNYENGQINFADSVPENSAAFDLRTRGLTIRVLDTKGNLIAGFGKFRDLAAPAASLVAAQHNASALVTLSNSADSSPVRLYTAPIVEEGKWVGTVQVAQSLADVQDTLNQLLRALILGGVGLLALAAAGGYFLAARALAPIDRITQTARNISAQDLSARLNLPTTDDEVGRLAATFDAMLIRLDDALRRERQFVAGASHDLRTPLAAIQAILDVTRAKTRAPQEYQVSLDDIWLEAQRLQTLTDELLQLARGDARMPMSHDLIDLRMLLNDVCDSMQPLAQAKDILLTCEVADAPKVRGDSDALIRMFANLIENALKYTAQGRVTVTARADDAHQARIQVRDTGSGIDAEQLPHIFDSFYRADASRSTPGAGLGLAIARDVARTHGGNIQVESTVGRGSTFTVLLPLASEVPTQPR